MAIVKDAYGKERVPSSSSTRAASNRTSSFSGLSSNDQRAEQQAIRNMQSSASAASASKPRAANTSGNNYEVHTAGTQTTSNYAPSSNYTSEDQRREQLAVRKLAESYKAVQEEKANAFRQRLNEENAYWINPVDEQRAEQITLRSANPKARNLTAEQLSKELWPALQERLQKLRHYDHSFYSAYNEIDIQFSDADIDYFEAAETLQKNVEELQTMRQQVESGERDFGNKTRNRQFLEFVDEKFATVDRQMRQNLAEYVEQSRITPYAKDQLTHLANELSFVQLAELNDVIRDKGIRRVTKEPNWEKMMRAILSDQDAASQIAVDENYSVIAPHIWSGADIVEQEEITISGYFYENRQYWAKVTCGVEVKRIPLGKTIPRDVTLQITRATEWDMAGEQLELLAKMYLSPQFLVDGVYGTAANMGYVDWLPDGILPSDIPIIGEMLTDMDIFDHTAHITKETVFVTAFIDKNNWNDNAMEQVRFKTYH